MQMKYSYEGLNKRGVTTLICFLYFFFLFVMPVNVLAFGEKPLEINDVIPDIQFPVPQSDSHRNYLGLKDSGKFFLEDINARFLLIQIYTMY